MMFLFTATTAYSGQLYALFSNRLIFAIALTISCILLHRFCKTDKKDVVAGCHRIGMVGRSNLDDNGRFESSGDARVMALFVYPVKSCQGVELQTSGVTATGLKYDRMFAFAEFNPTGGAINGGNQWKVLTQRECPMLARLKTEIWLPDEPVQSGETDEWRSNGGCLVVRFPAQRGGKRVWMREIRIPIRPNQARWETRRYVRETVSIWKDQPQSVNITNEVIPEILKELARFLGVSGSLGLFRVDETALRQITRSLPKNPPWSLKNFVVGFADAFPIHLISLPSIRSVADDLPGQLNALDPRRFRANVYISGVLAFDEDSWKRVRIGEYVRCDYHIACRTARCIMTNVHQDSGVVNRQEPLATLKRTRQVDEGAKPHPCLGLSVIPLFDKGVLQVGQRVRVDRRGLHVYEKMFA